MAAELEKIAHRLKENGYPMGGELIGEFARSLIRQGLIPERFPNPVYILDEKILDLNPGETSEYLRGLGLSPKTANVLCRSSFDMRKLAAASDKDLLSVRNMGPKLLREVRGLIPSPTIPEPE